jgi:hypothetical protein
MERRVTYKRWDKHSWVARYRYLNTHISAADTQQPSHPSGKGTSWSFRDHSIKDKKQKKKKVSDKNLRGEGSSGVSAVKLVSYLYTSSSVYMLGDGRSLYLSDGVTARTQIDPDTGRGILIWLARGEALRPQEIRLKAREQSCFFFFFFLVRQPTILFNSTSYSAHVQKFAQFFFWRHNLKLFSTVPVPLVSSFFIRPPMRGFRN